MPENRQLAIILFADIEGYTSIMQKDEQMASTQLRRFHEELESKIKNHDGRIVNFYGDGALCIFQNPIKAVHAAMELQQSFQVSPTIPVRIGLHSGSVVLEGDKVFGDSINIASRIESMGTPGAILLSKKIRDEIKNQAEFKFTSLGNFEFKNVDEPLELYALANAGFTIPKRDQMEGKLKSTQHTTRFQSNRIKYALAGAGLIAFVIFCGVLIKNYRKASDSNVHGIQSIAVLPFRNLSADRSQDFFAEGMVEMIQSKLSEVQSLKIISMTSTRDYRDHRKPIKIIAQELKVNNILEGSVLRDENKVRIIVKLINTMTNEQLWTQTFEKDLTDIFAIQSSISQSVVTALKTKLSGSEFNKLAKVHSGDPAAYDLYLSGLEFQRYARFDTLKNYLALSKFQQSIRLDPNFDPAFVSLANCWYNRRRFGCSEPCRDSATYYADIALNLNPDNADALVLKGQIAWDRIDYLKAKQYFEQALEIAPNNSDAMNYLANYFLLETDEVDKALALFVEALSRDPRNDGVDENMQLYRNLGWVYERADMLDAALVFHKKALKIATGGKRGILINLGQIAVLQGHFQEALEYYDSSGIKNSSTFDVLDLWAFANDLGGNYKVAEAAYAKMLEMIKNGFAEDVQTHTFRHRYAHILWVKGQKVDAKKQFDLALKKLTADVADGTRHRGQEYDIAGIYNFLGDKELAYHWLEKMPFGEYTYKLIRVDPLFKDMIGTPRYEAIMAPHHEKVKKMQDGIRKLEANGQLMKELKN